LSLLNFQISISSGGCLLIYSAELQQFKRTTS